MAKYNNNKMNKKSSKYAYRYNYFKKKYIFPKHSFKKGIPSSRYKYRYNYYLNDVKKYMIEDHTSDWIDLTQLLSLPMFPMNNGSFVIPMNLPPIEPTKNNKKTKHTDVSGNIPNKKPKLSNPSTFQNVPENIFPNITVISGNSKNNKDPISAIIPEINRAILDALNSNKKKNNDDDEIITMEVKPKSIKKPYEFTDEEETYPFEVLDKKIESIEDLIELGKDYETKYKPMKKKFNINIRVLSDLVEPLTDLKNMIGMTNIKKSIFNKIILYLQGLENSHKDFLHTVLCGGPGMGKTDVAKIIGRIYSKMGFLSNGKFIEAKLTDLKAGYLGQTEIKTQKLLDDAKGCVLFFDEAYSLGGDDKIDSYSQSIIDIINPYLDKYRNDFVLIIAGYKEDLLKRFFKGNQGLRSRFGLWLEIDNYNAAQMKQIFLKKVLDYGWKVKDEEIKVDFFENNKDFFKFFGRDMENLFSKCKVSHAKRVLYEKPENKKILNIDDLKKGFDIYKKEMLDDSNEIRDYIKNHMFL